MRKEGLPDLNRSCTYCLCQRCMPDIAVNAYVALIWRDDMDQRWPETFVRVAKYPLGFRPSWANGQDLGLLHLYEVPPILEKEPLELEDSRLWC